MENKVTKEQVFKAFSERKIGYITALSYLGSNNYDEFLTEYFEAGYDYPRATEKEIQQAIKDYNELFGDNS